MTTEPSGTILALDPGTKFVGVAVSNPEQTMAFPVQVLPAARASLLPVLKKIIAEREVREIIVGRPAGLRGSAIPMTKWATDFADWLRAELNLPVTLIDERLSTRAAKQTTDATRVDAVAAALLLETYLGQRKHQRT